MATPVWLLDVDGVINACTRKPNTSVWPADAWNEGKAEAEGRRFTIQWATPVIDFIRNVHESGYAEIRWHTTWQHHASAIEALTGLPAFPVAHAPELDDKPGYVAKAIRESKSWWWKLPAAERVVRDELRPLIWTDDDITWSLRGYDVDGGLRAYAPALLVSPDERTGLTQKQLRQISDFIAHQRLAAMEVAS